MADAWDEAVEELMAAVRAFLDLIDNPMEPTAEDWKAKYKPAEDRMRAVLTTLEDAERAVCGLEWDGEKVVRREACAEHTAEAEKLGLYGNPAASDALMRAGPEELAAAARKAADLAEFPEPPIDAWDAAKRGLNRAREMDAIALPGVCLHCGEPNDTHAPDCDR